MKYDRELTAVCFHSDYDFILTYRRSAVILIALTKPSKALTFYISALALFDLHLIICLCLSVVAAGW